MKKNSYFLAKDSNKASDIWMRILLDLVLAPINSETLFVHYLLIVVYPVLNNLARGELLSAYARVATAQGKQGIWLLTFPDRENTGNLVNLSFYTGKILKI